MKDMKKKKSRRHLPCGLPGDVVLVGGFAILLLPFLVYAFGVGAAWMGAGCFAGMAVMWNTESYRLMRYARKDPEIRSLPGYFRHRFLKRESFLSLLSAVLPAVICLILYSMLLQEAGLLAAKLTGKNRVPAEFLLMLLTVFSLVTTERKDRRRAAASGMLLFFVSAVLVILFMLLQHTLGEIVYYDMHTGLKTSVSRYFSFLYMDGSPLKPADYISLVVSGFVMAWIPDMALGFLSAEDAGEITRGKGNSLVTFLVFLGFCGVFCGIVRGYLYPEKVTESITGFMKLVYEKMQQDKGGSIPAVLYLLAVFAAFFFLLEGCLFTSVYGVWHDILPGITRDRRRDEERRKTFRITAGGMGALGLLTGLEMGEFHFESFLVFVFLLCCPLGTVVLVSLCSGKINEASLTAGFIAGTVSVPFFQYAEIISTGQGYASISAYTGICSACWAVLSTLLVTGIVRIFTKSAGPEVSRDFENVKNRID